MTGHRANLHYSLSSIFDISSDRSLTPSLSINTYYTYSYERGVIASLYAGEHANYGYFEMIYKFGTKQKSANTLP